MNSLSISRRTRLAGAFSALALCATAPLVASASPLERDLPTQATGPVFTDMDNYLDRPEYQHFLTQEIRWDAAVCPAGSADVLKPLPAGVSLECARVKVPADWHDVTRGTIDLGISRTSTDAADLNARSKRLMLMNPGGPGGAGIIYAPYITLLTGTIGTHIGVGIDPRGVNLSTNLECPEVPGPSSSPGADGDSRSFTWAEVEAYNAYEAAKSDACAAVTPHYRYLNTEQTARDFTFVRALLGYQTADFFGTSYGTRLGSVIGRMFPNQFDRLVLDSNSALALKGQDSWRLKVPAGQYMFDKVAIPFWSRHPDVFALGDTPVAVEGAVNEVLRRARGGEYGDITPDVIDNQLWQAGNRPASLEEVGKFLRELREYTPGDAAPAVMADLPVSGRSANGDLVYYSNDLNTAVVCGDEGRSLRARERFIEMEANVRNMPVRSAALITDKCTGSHGPAAVNDDILQRPLRNTVFVHAEGDAVTSYAGAVTAVQMFRERGDAATLRFITIDDMVAHGIWQMNKCAAPSIRNFFREGVVPATDLACQAGPLVPSMEREVYEIGHNRRSDTQHPKPYQYVMRDIVPAEVDQAATAAWQAQNPVGYGATEEDLLLARIEQFTSATNARWMP